MHVLLCSQQVKRRCRWLVSFADGELADAASSSGDPFEGQRIDANMLGGAPLCLYPMPAASLSNSAVLANPRALQACSQCLLMWCSRKKLSSAVLVNPRAVRPCSQCLLVRCGRKSRAELRRLAEE